MRVSTLLDMVNAAYHDKPLIFIRQGYTFEFIKAVSDIVFDMINAAYQEKPLIFMVLLCRVLL